MVRISDARMSGTAFGTIVLHIAPELAVGGPLGVVRNGDMIKLDVPARSIELLIDEEEMRQRLEVLNATRRNDAPARGYAKLFHESVLQADEGCDFDFLIGGAGLPEK